MTTRRTRAKTANNPTDVETKTKAFDARRALRTQEDAREEEHLMVVRKTLADALLNTVAVQRDLQREDIARLLCKVLETFNFRKYFLIDESSSSILQHLMDELEEYAHKLVDPAVPDQYIRNLPLEDLKGMLTARRGQLCARLELLRTAHNNLHIRLVGWEDVFIHFKMVAIQVWMEMLDLTLVLRYLSGDPLKEELQERRAFVQESVIPVMDMFLLEMRDKQVLQPALYVDYRITSMSQGTVKGEGSEASVDGAFSTPAEEETEQIEGRVKAMTLELTGRPPQEVIRAQHERAAAKAMGGRRLNVSRARMCRRFPRSRACRRNASFK